MPVPVAAAAGVAVDVGVGHPVVLRGQPGAALPAVLPAVRRQLPRLPPQHLHRRVHLRLLKIVSS